MPVKDKICVRGHLEKTLHRMCIFRKTNDVFPLCTRLENSFVKNWKEITPSTSNKLFETIGILPKLSLIEINPFLIMSGACVWNVKKYIVEYIYTVYMHVSAMAGSASSSGKCRAMYLFILSMTQESSALSLESGSTSGPQWRQILNAYPIGE